MQGSAGSGHYMTLSDIAWHGLFAAVFMVILFSSCVPMRVADLHLHASDAASLALA